MLPHRPKHTLANRLFRATIGLFVVFTLLSTSLQLYMEHRHTEDLLLSDVEKVRTTFEPALTSALWAFDLNRVEDIVNGMAELPDISAVIIFDEEGQVVAIGRKSGSATPNTFQVSDLIGGSGVAPLALRFPLTHTSFQDEIPRYLGHGTIYIEENAVLNRLEFGFLLIIATTFLEIALMAIVLYFAVYILLGRPLGALSREVAALDETNIGQRPIDVGLRNKSELTIMEDAVNTLSARLRSSFNRIGHLNAELSKSVDVREQQLQTTRTELASSAQTLSAVLNNTFQFIGICDPDGKLIHANKASLYTLGQQPDSLIGTYLWHSKSMQHDQELINKVRNAVHQALAGYFSRFDIVIKEHETAEGRAFDFIISPVRDHLGAVSMIVCEAHDITQQKHAEEMASRSAQMAESANRAKSSFLATMSHEIRTPMNGVVGMLDILQSTTLNPHQIKTVGTIRRSAFALLDILDDILDFSKIEAGKLDLEYIPVPLRRFVADVTETFASSAAQKGIILREYIDPALPFEVMGDEVRLRQILYNLVGNALKFTGNDESVTGEIDVRAELVETTEDNGFIIQFRVIDNGIGINLQRQNHLFKAFSQAETSTTRRFGGSGLGLSITKRLAEMMKGEVTVISDIDQGSEFVVTLPLNAAKTPEGTLVVGDTPSLSGHTALVITQDQNTIERLTAYIEDVEGVPLFARDLEDAVEIQKNSGQDCFLVFVDDGYAPDNITNMLVKMGTSNLPEAQILCLTPWHDTQSSNDPSFNQLRINPLTRFEFDSVIRDAIEGSKRQPKLISEDLIASEAPSTPDALTFLEEQHTLAANPDLGITLLVAEDNEVNQEVLKIQLDLLGYAYVMTNNGSEAYSHYMDRKFDALLTDCHMPIMDGFELTHKIRLHERGTGGHIPIIAITANAIDGEADKCFTAGMDGFLSKPIELSALEEALATFTKDKINAAQA